MPDSLPLCLPDRTRTHAELRQHFVRLGLTQAPYLDRTVDRVGRTLGQLEGVPPSTAAAQAVASWVGQVLGIDLTHLLPDSIAPRTALAAVLLSEIAARWPQHFLADGPIPKEMAEALRAALVLPVPSILPLSMPEQSLDPVGSTVPRLPDWGLPAEQRSP